MIAISTGYRRLADEEVSAVAKALDDAWQHPALPMRQWITCVRGELERYRSGQKFAHFEALINAIKRTQLLTPSVLEVGAASGYYSQVLTIGGVDCEYTGVDYSEAYERLARELYPGIRFKVGDARALPFDDSSFDIVISGCVVIHVADYEKVIAESARVASKFVVMARTPVTIKTAYFEKLAYGVPTLEIWLGEDELLALFAKYSLEVISQEDTHSDPENHYAQRTYLLRKTSA